VLISECIGCDAFPCIDVRHDRYVLPEIDIDPTSITMLMISEAAPQDAADYFYAGRESLFQQTTLLAFHDAGVDAESIQDLIEMGVFFTTAVKCGKTGYGIKAATIKECSLILEQEIALFPNVKVFMLMGDVAIKALNYIAKREGEPRVIPAGATYKIRDASYYYRDKRVFPSYLQAGPSFFIEKSKRRMIAVDINAALHLMQ